VASGLKLISEPGVTLPSKYVVRPITLIVVMLVSAIGTNFALNESRFGFAVGFTTDICPALVLVSTYSLFGCQVKQQQMQNKNL